MALQYVLYSTCCPTMDIYAPLTMIQIRFVLSIIFDLDLSCYQTLSVASYPFIRHALKLCVGNMSLWTMGLGVGTLIATL